MTKNEKKLVMKFFGLMLASVLLIAIPLSIPVAVLVLLG